MVTTILLGAGVGLNYYAFPSQQSEITYYSVKVADEELKQKEKPKEEKKSSPKGLDEESKDNTLSTLSFNFIYYLIYKFKPGIRE